MEIFCKAIAESKDDGVKSFAIRTLKTFLQEGMYASELAATLASGTLVAESIAAVILTGRQLPPKIDAGICLLAMCGIDTNQLKHVVGLLPTLNDWMLTGPLISQHLALELIANLSSRFDLSEFILTQNSLHTVFELFVAIDDATMNSCDLEENEGAGFRKGYAQVRKTRQVGPGVGPTPAIYNCAPTGMHGPTFIFWANLTASSLPAGELHEFGPPAAAQCDQRLLESVFKRETISG